LVRVSSGCPGLWGRMLTCYAPVRRCPQGKPWFSLDLHVLGAPPAFVLSQDQTLHRDRDLHSSHVGGSSRPLIGELRIDHTRIEGQLCARRPEDRTSTELT